jgi:hypothetical protein
VAVPPTVEHGVQIAPQFAVAVSATHDAPHWCWPAAHVWGVK